MKFSNLSARRGPVHDIRSEAHGTQALYGPVRHSCGPGPVNLKDRPIGYQILKVHAGVVCYLCRVLSGDHILYTTYRFVVVLYLYFTVHHIPWVAARAGPRQLTGLLMGTVDVDIVEARVHNISWDPAPAGPTKHMGRLLGWAGRPI